MKYEVAFEGGIELKDGYNGNITARDASKIRGNMVKNDRICPKHMKD